MSTTHKARVTVSGSFHRHIDIETITDADIETYGEACLRNGDIGGWNLARSGLSDSPLTHRTELFAAIRARLVLRINAEMS